MDRPSTLYPYFQGKSLKSSNPQYQDVGQVASVPDHTRLIVNEKCDNDPNRQRKSQFKPSKSKEHPYISPEEENVDPSDIAHFNTKHVPVEPLMMPPDLITSKMLGEPNKLEDIAAMSNDGEVNSV